MLLHHNLKKVHTITLNRSSSLISSNYDISIDNKNKNEANNNDKFTNWIDILKVYKYLHLTVTKNIKKSLSLNLRNKVIVYQEREYNDKDIKTRIMIKIQHEKKVDGAVINYSHHIKRCNNFIPHFDDMDIDATNTVLEHDNDDLVNNFIIDNKQQIKKREENKVPHKQTAQNVNNLHKTPIILIDDDPDLLLTFNLFLKNEGYNNVKTFSDSKSLLKHVLDIDDLMHYKLAISDIRMPCINGIQLYQLLKILNPSIKILFVTSLDVANEISSIFSEVKSQDIIRKPVEGKHFIQMVNNKVRTI